MPKKLNLSGEQLKEMARKASYMKIAALAKDMGIGVATVQRYCKRMGVNFKTVVEPRKQMIRPPAEYTNLPSPYGIADELFND